MAMNRAQFKKQLQDGLNAVVGLEMKQIPEVWRQYVSYETESRKGYVEDVMMAGLKPAEVKAEGAGVAYDSTSETYVARYVFETLALAFAITEEAEEDTLYGSIGKRLAKFLARSYKAAVATRVANMLNNGFTGGATQGGDGVALFSASHPLKSGGFMSNLLTNAADLSETAVEDMSIQIDNTTDDRGIPMELEMQALVLPPALKFVGHRLLHSNLRVETPNNDTNAVKDMMLFPKGIIVDKRLTDTDAWFVTTDCLDGLKFIERKKPTQKLEGDFETGNMRYRIRGRSIQGWTNPRGAFGTAGG